ncbi:hypothetical protein Q4561_11710 [Alteromonas sp. 1_MG-2023]|uniref:hypothetical protein n=1 Tax=Alteromonas sp. 1_MG-2023 TaxID=3062669 RepID=UPI0026E14C7C|nr:hypothetical protein [Alteromonas sp. 1_MG-2023]MDO6567726.1 hypothetical protein [Alteromonas sp. 1_MG-2023]
MSPNEANALYILNNLNSEQIVNKEIEPEVGGSYIYNYVWGEVEDEYPVKKYLGDSLGLEHIFCWLREIWDCRDGSRILYYTDLPRSEAETKFEEHIIEEAQNWLKMYHNKQINAD